MLARINSSKKIQSNFIFVVVEGSSAIVVLVGSVEQRVATVVGASLEHLTHCLDVRLSHLQGLEL
jgi:hypothetical protein